MGDKEKGRVNKTNKEGEGGKGGRGREIGGRERGRRENKETAAELSDPPPPPLPSI